MKSNIKYNFTLLKGYSYTSKLLNNYNKHFTTAYLATSNISNSLIVGMPAVGSNKKYFHNHPVSKLEKILKKMNEKKLILSTPRENIDSIFKANKINKVEINKLLKFKRISNTSLLSNKLKTIKAAKASFTAPDKKQETKTTLISLSNKNIFSLEKNIQSLQAGVNNNKKFIELNSYQVNAVFKKNFNLLKNLLYYNSLIHINNKPYLFNNLFEAIFNNQVLSFECSKKASGIEANSTIAVRPQPVSDFERGQGLPNILSQDRLTLTALPLLSHLPTALHLNTQSLQTASGKVKAQKQNNTHLLASIKARKLINKTKKSITSLTKTIPKTLINKKKIDPFKKRYVDYIILQIKRKLFYARMSKLVNIIKKKYKIFAYEAKIEALKIINTGKGSRLDFESILIEEKNRRGINSEKKIIKLNTINRKIETMTDSSKSKNIFALNNIKKIMKFNNNLIQKKEKNFILCSKNNKLVTHVISKYNQMANKPKRKRNKRRGKLIKEKMRHRFYYPFLTKINIKGYLYTTSFIRYEDQVNILYKLYLAKILKYKFKYLSSFAYIMKNSKRSVNKHLLSALASKKRKAIDRTLVDSTLIKAMKKRIQKRIKKGKRSKRIIRFIDNYYRYVYPKNGIKFNLLKIPRYKWYTLKIRKHYINKQLKFALNKYKNKLNLNLLKKYKKHLHSCWPTFRPWPIERPFRADTSALQPVFVPAAFALAYTNVHGIECTAEAKHTVISKAKEIESSNRETKALLKRWKKKNYLIKIAIQRWLKLNTEKRFLKLHKSAFTDYSYYTNLNSYNTPIRKDSLTISSEKKEFLKNFLINDWLNKENLVKDNYIIKNIKNELIANYFLNKIFARKFKSFDSLSYEPKFLLDLLPYQMIDFFKHFTFRGPEAPMALASKPWPLIKTSVEYSVPIHFGTQMTINLFRNLIVKQKAAKAKNKHKNLLTFSLKGNIYNLANYRNNKNKFIKLYTAGHGPSASLLRSCFSLAQEGTYGMYGMLAYLINLQMRSQSTTIESFQDLSGLSTEIYSIKLILNILLLKEIEKNNRFKFINTFITFASSLQNSPKNSINLLLQHTSTSRRSHCGRDLSRAMANKYTDILPAIASKQEASLPAALQNIKLKNIVKVIQKLNLLKKIKLIRKIKEVIFNKNKQFYLERLVNNIIVYNFRKKINVLSSKLEKQASFMPKTSNEVIRRAKITKVSNVEHSVADGTRMPAKIQQQLGLRKLLLKSKLKSLQHIQSNNKTLGREIITYNFNQNVRRLNIFNSLNFTGSLVAFRRSHGLYLNISVLIKYFFKTIGGAIISKPLFIFNQNKITIKFFYYLSKNIYFFSTSEKNKLLFLWLKNSNLEPDYNIMKKYNNILTKTPNIPFKWTTLKNYSTNKALRNHMRGMQNKRKVTKNARLTKYFLSKNNILENFKKEINAFTYILESYFNCSIQLEITRLKYPFYNSNILSQLIGLNGKKYGYEQVLRKLFPKIYIRNPKTTLTKYDLSPKRKKALVSYLSGIKLKIAGRFYRHKIIPKKTVKTYQRGSLQRGVINFVDSSKYINKGKRGSFCITLTLSHIF